MILNFLSNKNELIGKRNNVLISATGRLKNNIIHFTKNDL